jgi:DNA-binding transcriptional LysR family regulator
MADLRALTLKQLRAHEATVRHGSVTSAARELLVTPPAITAQLKSLEDLVGSPLYHRAGEGFAPTEVGRVILKLAEEVELLVGQAQQKCLALAAGATGTITLGAVSTAKYIVPAIVARFRALHPDISVQLVIGNREDIIRGLERNHYDVLIMGRPPDHLRLDARVIGDHPHIIIAWPGHPLAARPALEPSDLAGERFLSREVGSGTRLLMERLLVRIGQDKPVETIEMGTNETIKQSVMAGLGVAFISAHTCLSELADGKLVALRIKGLPLVRHWHVLHRADRDLSRAAGLFEAFVLESWPKLVPPLAALETEDRSGP